MLLPPQLFVTEVVTARILYIPQLPPAGPPLPPGDGCFDPLG